MPLKPESKWIIRNIIIKSNWKAINRTDDRAFVCGSFIENKLFDWNCALESYEFKLNLNFPEVPKRS